MKKRLIILLLFIPVLLSGQTIWHVSTSGNDANSGTESSPWRTISHATSVVPAIEGSDGDIILVHDGTHYIYNQCQVYNVHLRGQGYNTLVVSQITGTTRAISVTNTTGTVLNIANIRFSGNNMLAPHGLLVYNANNVSVHDCFFENFLRSAILFDGSSYRTGNRFYNNIVTNCAGGVTAGYGDESYAVEINRQTGFVFQNNTCNETVRPVTTSGIPLGGLGGTNGLQIIGNTITANYRLGSNWPFAVELWYQVNTTMTGNTIIGEIDFGGFGTTNLNFSQNIVGPVSAQGRSVTGLQIEQYCDSVVIERNTFRNVEQAIYFCMAWPSDKTNYGQNITIRSNLIYGVTGYETGFGIRFESGSNDLLGGLPCLPPTFVDGAYIYNNTITASTTSRADYGILLPSQGRTSGVSNLDVRNNIISGFSSYAIYAYRQDIDYSQAITTLTITYNNYYGNGSNSSYFSGFTPSGYTSATGIITTNPAFISTSDFHLQSTSGAIRAGTYISSVTTDRDGISFLNPPTIGAYEYTSSMSLPVVATSSITNITGTTALSGGYVSSDGGLLVTARGVCWDTSPGPIVADNATSDGEGTGSFTSNITGLSPNTTYYVRAYAINNVGTAYGNELVFYSASGSSTGSSEGFIKIGNTLIKNGNQFGKYDLP